MPSERRKLTEAGKRLLDDYPARYGGALYLDPVSRQLTIEAIAAIEAEARVAVLRELRAWITVRRGHVTLSEIEAEIDRRLAP